MKSSLLSLPDAETVSASIAIWRARNPALAVLLATGVPAPKALTRAGLQRQDEGGLAEAIEFFRAAVALNPGDSILWLNYGSALDRAGEPAAAIACLERSLELNPRRADTWVLLGFIRKKLGDSAGAETAYRAALEHNPQSVVAWQCLGLLQQEQRNLQAAADCFNECVRHGQVDAATFANLGRLHYELGRVEEAFQAYLRAAELDEASAHYRSQLARTRLMSEVLGGKAVTAALETYQTAAGAAASAELLEALFNYLNGFGQREAARRIGEQYLELWPERPVMRYLLAALSGDTRLERSPVEYVVEHFDAFAGTFDSQLVGVLHYDVPQKLCAAVQAAGSGRQYPEALDAGCGTGLCGAGLRPVVGRLTGVDLSSKMLDQARQKNVYDELACEELVQFLQRSPQRFDLIVAADVLIYLGNLRVVFSAAAMALRNGGLFAFSTETGEGTGYSLRTSGRFSHSPQYVRDVARDYFAEVSHSEAAIRLEANRPLPGNLFVFRRLEPAVA